MKDIYIADLKTGQDFMSYFIVKTVAVKVGSNKKAYLDLLLADKTGEIVRARSGISQMKKCRDCRKSKRAV